MTLFRSKVERVGECVPPGLFGVCELVTDERSGDLERDRHDVVLDVVTRGRFSCAEIGRGCAECGDELRQAGREVLGARSRFGEPLGVAAPEAFVVAAIVAVTNRGLDELRVDDEGARGVRVTWPRSAAGAITETSRRTRARDGL